MSEQVRKWGSISILSGIGGTLVATLLIWLFGQVIHIEPLIESVERIERTNNEGHQVITGLIKEQTTLMKDNEERLHTLEIERIYVDKGLNDCKAIHTTTDGNYGHK